MAYGWFGPDRAMSAVREVIGFPAKLGATELKREGNSIRASLTRDGVELIKATIAPKESLGIRGGMLHYPTMKEPPAAHGTQTLVSQLILNPPAFIGEIFPAEPVSIEFKVPDKDPLKKLEPKRLLQALYMKNVSFVLGYTDVVKEMR